ncbi:unnamed protein product [Ranitomeya imitator]|uniref:Uncharacterized protein n=1 Tax=Ranitomeya imitator TaxID=111125 RepID=A0ABN9KZ06_9NEOB|nr:unnamed protein product [Ranitomeya imitator]
MKDEGLHLETSLERKKEEPKLPQTSHSAFRGPAPGYGSANSSQLPSFYKIGSKRANFDEENAYFDDEEEDSSNVDLPYIPAENSPTRQQFRSKTTDSDSEEDPLEAFMAEVEDQAARDMRKLEEKDKEKKNARGIRDDIEEEDDQGVKLFILQKTSAGKPPTLYTWQYRV